MSEEVYDSVGITWNETPIVLGKEFGGGFPNLHGVDEDGNEILQVLDRWYALRYAMKVNKIMTNVKSGAFKPDEVVALTMANLPDGSRGGIVHLASEADIDRHKRVGCLQLSPIKKRKPKPKRSKAKRAVM